MQSIQSKQSRPTGAETPVVIVGREKVLPQKLLGSRLLVLLAILVAALLLLAVSPAKAETLTVTNTTDTGPGSLRATITAANNNGQADTIEISAIGTVELVSALPELSTDMNIVGPGADQFTVKRSEASGTPNFRIFTVGEGATVSISGLTVTNGVGVNQNFDAGKTPARGGGIGNFGGTLTVEDSAITGNTAESGGGIINGGISGGDLTVTGSTISANTAKDSGGIGNFGGNTLTVEDSTISGNTARDSGGISNGGGIGNSGDLTVTGSTITENTASADFGGSGGGISNGGGLTVTGSTISANTARHSGGGISNSGDLTVTGSTISGNTVEEGDGGGIVGEGFFTENGFVRSTATITNSTISGNSASGAGGGVYNKSSLTVIEYSTIIDNSAPDGQGGGVASSGDTDFQGEPLARTEVSSSIIAGNTTSDVDVVDDTTNNTFVSGGYNLIGVGNAIDAFNNTADQTGVTNPGLGPLAANGGPTLTHALLDGSPAIDQGNAGQLTTDQRGMTRPVDLDNISNPGDGSDIGAFELQGDGGEVDGGGGGGEVFNPPPTGPNTKADCKKGGYTEFGFTTQGQCIKAVNLADLGIGRTLPEEGSFVDSLNNLNPQDIQKYFEGVYFPLEKQDAVKVAQNNGAPQPLVDQLQQRLPEGQFSNPQEIVQGLGF